VIAPVGRLHRVALGIEYHGGAYCGWQSQAAAPSIQSALQAAVASVADMPVQLVAAGRTDAGVHALGQVAHFDCAHERGATAWVLGINSALAADISVSWASAVPPHFHARYAATARTYRYLILNRRARSALAAGRALLVHRPLDVERMNAAAALLVGEHDFSAFRAAECQARSPVRVVHALAVMRSRDWVWVEVTANAFLHHMVRNMVGVLLAVGRGDALPARAGEQLASRLRTTGEATAAAHGLYLWQVHYPSAFGLPEQSAMIWPGASTAAGSA
jgi:tRNA pseudouridine38-40 synthase